MIKPEHIKVAVPTPEEQEELMIFLRTVAVMELPCGTLEANPDNDVERDYHSISPDSLKKALGIIYDEARQRVVPSQLFEDMAKTELGIPTLEAQMRDSLDCHDLTTPGIKRILNTAFTAGQTAQGAC